MQCGGEVVSMAEQVGNFTRLVRTWERQKRRRQAAAAARLVSRSLVFISVGSNDLFEYSDFFADPKNRNVSRNDTAFLGGLVALYTAYVKVTPYLYLYQNAWTKLVIPNKRCRRNATGSVRRRGNQVLRR